VAVAPSSQPSETEAESGLELAHAATTPSAGLSAAVRAAKADADRPASRLGILVAGGVVLCVVVLAGVRAGMSGPSKDKTPEPPREVASAAPSAALASESASAPSSATAPASATAEAHPSRRAQPMPIATSTTRPKARPSGEPHATPPAGAAPPHNSRDSLDMDIK